MLDDAVPIRQILAGDKSAFEQLLQKYKGLALAMAFQYVQNEHDAQDIVQEAFYSAYINLPKLLDHSRFKQWFFQIVKNHSRMKAREQSRRNHRENVAIAVHNNIPIEYEQFTDSIAWKDIIEKAMESLSSSDHAIATLYFFDDHICREIAEALDLPIGTVKRRLHGIRKILKKEVRIMLNENGILKYNIGIETFGGLFTSLISKGDSLPVQKTITLTTIKDKQNIIYFHLLEGDSDFAKECRDLGEYEIKGFSAVPKGVPQIAVTISVEKDGTLSINAAEKQPQKRNVAVEDKYEDIERFVSIQAS